MPGMGNLHRWRTQWRLGLCKVLSRRVMAVTELRTQTPIKRHLCSTIPSTRLQRHSHSRRKACNEEFRQRMADQAARVPGSRKGVPSLAEAPKAKWMLSDVVKGLWPRLPRGNTRQEHISPSPTWPPWLSKYSPSSCGIPRQAHYSRGTYRPWLLTIALQVYLRFYCPSSFNLDQLSR